MNHIQYMYVFCVCSFFLLLLCLCIYVDGVGRGITFVYCPVLFMLFFLYIVLLNKRNQWIYWTKNVTCLSLWPSGCLSIRHSPALPHWEAECVVGPSCTAPQALTWSRCGRVDPLQRGLNSQLELTRTTSVWRTNQCLTLKGKNTSKLWSLPHTAYKALSVCACLKVKQMCVRWFIYWVCCYYG